MDSQLQVERFNWRNSWHIPGYYVKKFDKILFCQAGSM